MTSTPTPTTLLSSLFHFLAEIERPAIVGFSADNFSGDLITSNRLPKRIYIHRNSFVFNRRIRIIQFVNFFQEGPDGFGKSRVCRPCQKLERLHRVWSDRGSRIRDNVRHKIPRRQIMVRC